MAFEILTAGDSHELGDTSPLPLEQVHRAQLITCTFASDAADADLLLRVLGIHPSVSSAPPQRAAS